jgi:hypothetical protein
MTDSRHSSQSGQQVSYQVETSGLSGISGSGVGVSNLNVQKTAQYGQSGINTTYQSGTYQYGSSSGQFGASNLYSSTTSRESGTGNSGTVYQSGTSYQPGTTYQSGSSYQPYQPGSFQSGTSGTQPGNLGGNTGSSFNSSSYTYKKP